MLVGSETDILFAFGDAVCVPVVRWVVEHSIEQLIAGGRARDAAGVQDELVLA
jgi:hypothetical protein